MTAQPRPEPAALPPATCPLCDTPVAPGATRCAECGFDLRADPRGPSPFTRGSFWLLAGIVAAVYVVTLLVVAAAR